MQLDFLINTEDSKRELIEKINKLRYEQVLNPLPVDELMECSVEKLEQGMAIEQAEYNDMVQTCVRSDINPFPECKQSCKLWDLFQDEADCRRVCAGKFQQNNLVVK